MATGLKNDVTTSHLKKRIAILYKAQVGHPVGVIPARGLCRNSIFTRLWTRLWIQRLLRSPALKAERIHHGRYATGRPVNEVALLKFPKFLYMA